MTVCHPGARCRVRRYTLLAATLSVGVNRTTVAIGAAEVLGAVALGVATFTVPAFVDMSLGWRLLAVFMALEGGDRLSNELRD